MATIVRTLWSAAKWALLSCNDGALLARCPRHIQSVLNLIVDILVMVNWQLSRRVSADQCHMTVSQAQVYNSFGWRVFLELSTNKLPVLIFNWSQAQVHNEKAVWQITLISSIRSLQGNLRPQPWCFDLGITQSIHQGLGLRFACNDLTRG